MLFEKNLALLRKKNGISQEELALAIGVSRQTIYSWEAGLNYPNIVMLKKIAEILNVTTDELLNGFEVNKLPAEISNLDLNYKKKHQGIVNYDELPNWFIKLKPEEDVCWAIYDLKGNKFIKDYSYQIYTRGKALIHNLDCTEIEVKEYDESLTLTRVYSQFISLKEEGIAWVGESSLVGGVKVIKTYKDKDFLKNWGIDGKFAYQKTQYNEAEDYILDFEGKKLNVIKISYFDSEESTDPHKVYFEVFLNQNYESLVWRRYTKSSSKSKTTGVSFINNKDIYDLDYYVITSRLF